MRQASICIPTYNRYQFTIDSFAQVLNDDRVSEVVIADDCSTDDSYARLCEFFKNEPKVKLFTSGINKDCYFNKHRAVELATGEWVILFDSDNTLKPEYLDAIFALPWEKDFILQPQFARPHFDFRKWAGLILTKGNVAQYADTHLMTALNAMNFFINREEYLRVWDGSVNPGSSDSLYFNTCWLESGGSVLITPELEYDHYISKKNDGHYQTNYHLYVEFHENLMNRIKQLR